MYLLGYYVPDISDSSCLDNPVKVVHVPLISRALGRSRNHLLYQHLSGLLAESIQSNVKFAVILTIYVKYIATLCLLIKKCP